MAVFYTTDDYDQNGKEHRTFIGSNNFQETKIEISKLLLSKKNVAKSNKVISILINLFESVMTWKKLLEKSNNLRIILQKLSPTENHKEYKPFWTRVYVLVDTSWKNHCFLGALQCLEAFPLLTVGFMGWLPKVGLRGADINLDKSLAKMNFLGLVTDNSQLGETFLEKNKVTYLERAYVSGALIGKIKAKILVENLNQRGFVAICYPFQLHCETKKSVASLPLTWEMVNNEMVVHSKLSFQNQCTDKSNLPLINAFIYFDMDELFTYNKELVDEVDNENIYQIFAFDPIPGRNGTLTNGLFNVINRLLVKI